jgi:hypothetical protein
MPEIPISDPSLDGIPDELKPSLAAWRAACARAADAGVSRIVADGVLTDHRYEALLDAFAEFYVDTTANFAGVALTVEQRERAVDGTKLAVEQRAVETATAQLVDILDAGEDRVAQEVAAADEILDS